MNKLIGIIPAALQELENSFRDNIDMIHLFKRSWFDIECEKEIREDFNYYIFYIAALIIRRVIFIIESIKNNKCMYCSGFGEVYEPVKDSKKFNCQCYEEAICPRCKGTGRLFNLLNTEK